MRDQTPPSSPRDDDVEDLDDLVYVGELDEFLNEVDGEGDEEDIGTNESNFFIPGRDDSSKTFNHASADDSELSVFCGDISPNGQYIVTGGENDTVSIWNLETGNTINIDNHKDSVISVVFNSDGRYLASADMSGNVLVHKGIINGSTPEEVFNYYTGDLNWLFWHKVASYLFAGTQSGEVYIWKIPSGDCKILNGHGFAAESGVLIGDGRQILVGYADGYLKLWNLKECTIVFNMQVEQNPIYHLDCHMECNLVLTGSSDGVSKLVNSTNGKILETLQTGTSTIEAVAFSSETEFTLAAIGNVDGDIYIWDIGRNSIRHKLDTADNPAGVTCVKWLPGGKLISAHLNGCIYIFDCFSGNLEKTFMGHKSGILHLTVSKDNKFLLTTSDDGDAKIYNIE